MARVPAPFRVKTPFPSKVVGIGHQAFPLDFINPPFPGIGPPALRVEPTDIFAISGGCDQPYVPADTKTYTLTNIGGSELHWTATPSDPWILLSNDEGNLIGGAGSDTVIATIDHSTLPRSMTPYLGSISFVNETNAVGDVTVQVSLTQLFARDVWDDFEEYPEGPIVYWNGSTCWEAPGFFQPISGIYAYDDFQDYPVGPVAFLVYGSGWESDGFFFSTIDYPKAYDDFESYPTGTISALTFTAADSLWSADGFFGGPYP